MDLTFRRHRVIDAELSERWLHLAQRCGAGVFSTPQWCSAWLATIGSSATPLIVEALRGDDTVAVLPLCRVRRGAAVWLEMIGARGAAGDALDVVGSSQLSADELSGLIEQILDGEDRFDGLRLANLNGASPLASLIQQTADASGLAAYTSQRQCRPCIDLPATFDAYLATLSSNMRYHIRRRRRDAARIGAVVRRIVHDDELAAFLDSFFDLHAARWRNNGGGGFGDSAKQSFLRRYCRDALDRGWLRAIALTVDDTTVGVLIAFQFGDRCNFYQMGWRDDSDVASPGVVMLGASIESAIEERMAVYDFLQGDEAYKSRWTHRHDTQRTILIAQSMAARVAISAARIKHSFKHALGRGGAAAADAHSVSAGAQP